MKPFPLDVRKTCLVTGALVVASCSAREPVTATKYEGVAANAPVPPGPGTAARKTPPDPKPTIRPSPWQPPAVIDPVRPEVGNETPG